MSEVKQFITRWSRDFQGNLQEDPNGSWVLAADAAIRDKRLMDKIDALQLLLNAADQRIDEMTPCNDVQFALMPVERSYDVRAKQIIAFNTARQSGGDLDDALNAAYKVALRYTPCPVERPAAGEVSKPAQSI